MGMYSYEVLFVPFKSKVNTARKVHEILIHKLHLTYRLMHATRSEGHESENVVHTDSINM